MYTTTDIPVFVDSSLILTYIPISLSFSIISLLYANQFNADLSAWSVGAVTDMR